MAAPPNVASINQRIDGDSSAVEVELIGDVDVHSFREDKNYVIDVAFQQSDKPQVGAAARIGRASSAGAAAPVAAAPPQPATPAPRRAARAACRAR